MTIKLTNDKAAAVNTQTYWVEITPTSKPLTGARYLLINRQAGVAQIGPYRDDGWYTHYAGLPSFGAPTENPELVDLRKAHQELQDAYLRLEQQYTNLQEEFSEVLNRPWNP